MSWVGARLSSAIPIRCLRSRRRAAVWQRRTNAGLSLFERHPSSSSSSSVGSVRTDFPPGYGPFSKRDGGSKTAPTNVVGARPRSFRTDARGRGRHHPTAAAAAAAASLRSNRLRSTPRPHHHPTATPTVRSFTTRTAETSYPSDLIVVLDMDECLVHSEFLRAPSSDADDYRRYGSDRAAESRPSVSPPNSDLPPCESFLVTLSDGDEVRVNKRPSLDAFLHRVTRRYETYVFTAAMEVYASPVLDTLDPDGDMFAGRFYRESCTFDERSGAYVKDLSGCGFGGERRTYDAGRTVLVDNNPYSFLADPANGILVSNFYDDPRDDTLGSVVELLGELEGVEDVRPVLDGRFGLREALREATGKRY